MPAVNAGPTGKAPAVTADMGGVAPARLRQLPRLLPVLLALLLAVVAYSSGMAIGFVSDDFNWLRQGAHDQLGWAASFRLNPHSNALPFEIALYHLKFVLFGFDATPYHVFAVAGHLANILLIYVLAGRIGLSRPVACLSALLAAVMAAGAQAVYWMSGDPHVWATLLTLSALILYIDHCRQGGWWRYAAAILLAVVAPLVKAEGVGVIGGVLAFELFWHRPAGLTWKVVPFALAPIPFVLWEWATQDQLQTHRGFGLNVLSGGLGYLKQILLPLDPAHYFMATGGRLHVTLVALGIGLYLEAAGIVVLLVMALRRRGGTVRRRGHGACARGHARHTVTLRVLRGPGGSGDRSRRRQRPVRTPSRSDGFEPAHGARGVFCAALVGCQLVMTFQESSALRAAHNEAQALLAAVLSDHPSVRDGTAICLLNTPLDTGSATGVFADPRLGPNVGIPNVTICSSATNIPPGVWAYEREPDGTYKQLQ